MSSSKEAQASIKHLILSKIEYESKLNMILKKYFIKYFKEIYDEVKIYKEFQKKLYNIPSWSSDKISREFGYFTKYVNKKYDLNQNELSKILEIIYTLNIKIMTPLFNYPINNIPKFKDFWYKCIKKFGKFYYENPKSIKDSETSNYLDDTVKNVIQNFIPIKDIINTEKQHLEKYDFENEPFSEKTKDSSFTKLQDSSNAKLEIERENTEYSEKLKHAATSDFENEYYNSEIEKENNKIENDLIVDEQEEKEKQIELPKYLFNKKKNYFNYKLSKMKKKNEMDENFFD
jgi:hypothetical protein